MTLNWHTTTYLFSPNIHVDSINALGLISHSQIYWSINPTTLNKNKITIYMERKGRQTTENILILHNITKAVNSPWNKKKLNAFNLSILGHWNEGYWIYYSHFEKFHKSVKRKSLPCIHYLYVYTTNQFVTIQLKNTWSMKYKTKKL